MTGDAGRKGPAGGRAGVEPQLAAAVPEAARRTCEEAFAHRCWARAEDIPAEGSGDTDGGARGSRPSPLRGAGGFSQSIGIEAMGGCLLRKK